MNNLLKQEIKTILFSKSTIICLCLAIGFSFVSVGLYSLINLLASNETIELSSIKLSDVLAGTISISSDFVLMIPVFIAITISKEFSFGTVRNKIISGCSRNKIFISYFITSFCYYLVFILFYFLLFFALGAIMLPIGNITSGLILSILLMIVILSLGFASFISFISCFTRSMVPSIIIAIVTPIVLTILYSLFSLDNIPTFMNELNNLNVLTQLSSITSDGLSSKMLCYVFFGGLGFAIFFMALGLYTFNKVDLK